MRRSCIISTIDLLGNNAGQLHMTGKIILLNWPTESISFNIHSCFISVIYWNYSKYKLKFGLMRIWRCNSHFHINLGNHVVKNVLKIFNTTGINCVDIHTCVIRDYTSCVILTRHPTWHIFLVNVHIMVHCGYVGSIYTNAVYYEENTP